MQGSVEVVNEAPDELSDENMVKERREIVQRNANMIHLIPHTGLFHANPFPLAAKNGFDNRFPGFVIDLCKSGINTEPFSVSSWFLLPFIHPYDICDELDSVLKC